MSDATTVTLPTFPPQELDLTKLNQALDAVVQNETEESGRYQLVHTHGWAAVEAVTYAGAAQFCCDNSLDPNDL